MIEGGQVDVLAEEMEEDVGVDLSVGVCFQKYEEPGPCGSAGDFLLGEEIEGEQPGREEVVGDALIAAETDFSFNFNGSNKCQLTSLIDVAPVDDDQVNDSVAPAAVNDIQEAAIAIDLLAAVDQDLLAAVDVQDLLPAAVDMDIFVDHFHDFEATAPVDDNQVEYDLGVNMHLPVERKKMPKRKHKFGKGAKRGGDRKSCREVDATALVDPTALVARERPTTTAVPVKRMNKKQLHRSLHSTTKKLICAKKKATATAKKLSAAKAQCTIIAKIAQDRRKESNLAHQKAESEVNAIRDEMKIAKALCDN